MALTFEALMVWAVAPLTMLAVSAVYFYTSPAAEPLYLRALVASSGVVGAVLFIGALLAPVQLSPSPAFREPILAAWAVPVVLVGFSLWRFAGPRRVHLLLPALGAAMLWALVVSYTVVGGGK